MKRALLCLFILAIAFSVIAEPTTRNNDDSCDISALPAATLLLPYFEVDLSSRNGADTLFSVTNVTRLPRIARVTLWTDYAYPLFSFNLFLTGYDMQSISVFDILHDGVVAPPNGTTSESDVGRRSAENDENVLLDVSDCDDLAVDIPPAVVAMIRSALTTGRIDACGTAKVGAAHDRAVGYLTIDVVNRCSSTLPTDAGYFTQELLYDNVLIGDYQQVDRANDFAQGGTMVHIRAVPEGGGPGSLPTDLERTFYSRYQAGGTTDRRQPLPSTFAARWISGGTGDLQTTFKIWREGVTGAGAGCAVAANSTNSIIETVRFDEDENPMALSPDVEGPEIIIDVPPVALIAANDYFYFPPNPGGDLAGWMYLNLDGEQPAGSASQNWVVVSMAAEGRFSTEFDALALGNGCTPTAPVTAEDGSAPAIAPANNVISTEARTAPSTINNDDSCDISALPAATLLLPYFEVDLASRQRATTIFTITNVTQLPQIARVTIWTDRSYPMLTFSLFLTGYDVQVIDLFDILGNGIIAPPNGTNSHWDEGVRSFENDDNPLLDIRACDELRVGLPPALLEPIRLGLTTGLIASCGTARVGNPQPDGHARGYVTIDLAQHCSPSRLPTDPGYFTTDILFDNVLMGDYHQVDRANNFAQGGTMVHIRAIPEGGAPGAKATQLERTFYSRHQSGGTADRRQPLPSTFAAHWISGGPGAFNTAFKIWRDAVTGVGAGCSVQPNAVNEYTEIVRFDEDENPVVYLDNCPILGCTEPRTFTLPSVAQVDAQDFSIFPANAGGDLSGWMYFNLGKQLMIGGVATQGWVIGSLGAEGRFSVDFDAVALGNGCSPAAPMTAEDGFAPFIGPSPNGNP